MSSASLPSTEGNPVGCPTEVLPVCVCVYVSVCGRGLGVVLPVAVRQIDSQTSFFEASSLRWAQASFLSSGVHSMGCLLFLCRTLSLLSKLSEAFYPLQSSNQAPAYAAQLDKEGF